MKGASKRDLSKASIVGVDWDCHGNWVSRVYFEFGFLFSISCGAPWCPHGSRKNMGFGLSTCPVAK